MQNAHTFLLLSTDIYYAFVHIWFMAVFRKMFGMVLAAAWYIQVQVIFQHVHQLKCLLVFCGKMFVHPKWTHLQRRIWILDTNTTQFRIRMLLLYVHKMHVRILHRRNSHELIVRFSLMNILFWQLLTFCSAVVFYCCAFLSLAWFLRILSNGTASD